MLAAASLDAAASELAAAELDAASLLAAALDAATLLVDALPEAALDAAPEDAPPEQAAKPMGKTTAIAAIKSSMDPILMLAIVHGPDIDAENRKSASIRAPWTVFNCCCINMSLMDAVLMLAVVHGPDIDAKFLEIAPISAPWTIHADQLHQSRIHMQILAKAAVKHRDSSAVKA